MTKRRHGFPAVPGLQKKRTKNGHRWILSEQDSTGKILNVTVPILDTDTDKIFFEKIDAARNLIRTRSKSMYDWIAEYIDARKLADTTAACVRSTLKRFTIYDNIANRKEIELMMKRGKRTSQATKLARIRVFYDWLGKMVPGVMNPADGVEIYSRPHYRKRVATDEEIEFIKREIERKGDDRLMLFFLLLIHTGARCSTIEAMTPKSLDRNGRLTLYNVKTKKRYSYTIPMVDRELVQVWRRVVKSGELWTDQDKRRLRNRLLLVMRKLGRDASGETLSPHSLRHTFATRALQAGVPAEIVSKLLDHSSVSITLNVYARFSQEQIDDAMSKIKY